MDKMTKDIFTLCSGQEVDLEKFWETLKTEGQKVVEQEQALAPLIEDIILERKDFSDSLATRLARKLARDDMSQAQVYQILSSIIQKDEELQQSVARDILAIYDRDPACHSPLEPLLFFKGLHAITNYRISNILWREERKYLALYFQSIGSEVFQVDIHPAADIGCGIMLDHATSFVVGETGVIEDNVSILHEVTLGGTGKESGLRHPIVRTGVMIGAGAKILGRVEIGNNAKVGGGSVVLEDVPPNVTVVGVPARIVETKTGGNPALEMNQQL